MFYCIYLHTIHHLLYCFVVPDNCEELAHLLSQVLQTYCSRLNTFFQKETLSAFANKMCEAGIITVELRDNPVYNAIEGQFTATLTFLSTKEEFETYCKDFLSALRSQGGPLELCTNKLRGEWKNKASTQLNVDLNL